MGKDYDYRAVDSVYNLSHSVLTDIEPNFNSIILSKGAKLTDLISSAPVPWYDLLVSKKLLDILSKFHLPIHEVFDVHVLHGGQSVKNYYAIQFVENQLYLKHVDFPRSLFWIVHYITNEKIEQIYPLSSADIHDIAHRIRGFELRKTIWAESLVLDKTILDETDLFSCSEITFPPCFYVSNSLHDSVVSANCTGIDFARADELKLVYPTFGRVYSIVSIE